MRDLSGFLFVNEEDRDVAIGTCAAGVIVSLDHLVSAYEKVCIQWHG